MLGRLLGTDVPHELDADDQGAVVAARFQHGNEVVIEIAPCRPLVGMGRVVVLPGLHHIARVREREPDIARVVADGIATGMIKVKM